MARGLSNSLTLSLTFSRCLHSIFKGITTPIFGERCRLARYTSGISPLLRFTMSCSTTFPPFSGLKTSKIFVPFVYLAELPRMEVVLVKPYPHGEPARYLPEIVHLGEVRLRSANPTESTGYSLASTTETSTDATV
ncbi:hypothetical protein E1B28_001850 [Marasmius oreades]|uniref:Uncharacterized protein n=1 Tax=Marasmius oreades TaxID=181124 RepID=A0A9P7V4F3_9AGAR|nr:uncharacterized protein E1B28_001850 [Marasmius oreades]KAG7100066.1 hypothetical protein E1B28_001850 [Marasmius oreades]